MNSNTQLRIVMTLALAAGLAAPAAACPPDEQGGSPDPAQDVLIKQLPGGGAVMVRGVGAAGGFASRGRVHSRSIDSSACRARPSSSAVGSRDKVTP